MVSESGDEDGFVPGCMAVRELDLTRVTMEAVGEETDEGLIGGGIDWWCGDTDAEFIRERTGDGIGGSAGQKFN